MDGAGKGRWDSFSFPLFAEVSGFMHWVPVEGCMKALPPSSSSLLSLAIITRCYHSLLSLAVITRCYHSLLSLAVITRCYHSLLSLAVITRCHYSLSSLSFGLDVSIGPISDVS